MAQLGRPVRAFFADVNRSVLTVSIARSENFLGPPGRPEGQPQGAALAADERAELIRLQLNDVEIAQHPVIEARGSCRGSLTYRGMRPSERKDRVMDALEKVEMAHRAKHLPSQLSGGQQQRVAVARAVAGQPSILLAESRPGTSTRRTARRS